jgi:drug/metabolite transporter (DMT)-like permease
MTAIDGSAFLLHVNASMTRRGEHHHSRAAVPFLAILAVIFSVVMWGLVPVAVRHLVTTMSPEAALLLRLYPAGVLAAVVLVFVGMRPIDREDLPRILLAPLIGYVGYQILANYGQKTVPAAWTGMLFGLEPVFVALFAVLLAGEHLTQWLVAGLVLAIAGTAVLFLGSSSGIAADVGTGGLILVAVSAMGWGVFTVLLRPLLPKYGAFQLSCLTLAISAFPMLVFASPELLAAVPTMTAAQIGAVAFLAIPATFLAVAAWNFGAARMSNAAAGMFLYVQPIVAAIGGMLILGETITWPLLAGGALIIAGVAIAQFKPASVRSMTLPEEAA